MAHRRKRKDTVRDDINSALRIVGAGAAGAAAPFVINKIGRRLTRPPRRLRDSYQDQANVEFMKGLARAVAPITAGTGAYSQAKREKRK